MADEKMCPLHSGIVKSMEAIEREIGIRFSNLEKVTEATKQDLNKRLETMNEFRAQLDKQAKTFASKSAIDVSLSNHAEKIEQQRKEMSGMKNWLIGLLVAVIINLVGVILLLIRT